MILDASLADCQSTDKCTQSLLRREKRETIRTKAYRPCRFAASIGRPRIADGDQSGNQNSLRYREAVTTYYCGPTVFVGFTPESGHVQLGYLLWANSGHGRSTRLNHLHARPTISASSVQEFLRPRG